MEKVGVRLLGRPWIGVGGDGFGGGGAGGAEDAGAGGHEGVAGFGAAGWGETDAGADLGFLLREALAGELNVSEVVHAKGGSAGDEGWVAFMNLDGGGGWVGGVCVGDVIVKEGGDGLAGGVVEHAFSGDAGEGDAGVDSERGPGGEVHFGKILGSAAARKTSWEISPAT